MPLRPPLEISFKVQLMTEKDSTRLEVLNMLNKPIQLLKQEDWVDNPEWRISTLTLEYQDGHMRTNIMEYL